MKNRKFAYRDFMIKNWFYIHLVFVVFFTTYILYKVLFVKGLNPLYNRSDVNPEFDTAGFLLMIMGFSLFFSCLILNRVKKQWVIVLSASGYLLISLGYIRIKDPELKWEGSDVANGNYNAAIEMKREGIFRSIKSWNDRANPYIKDHFQDVSDSVKEMMSRYNLSWIKFNKWKTPSFPAGFDPENNRPFMHPPMAPVILSLWLALFPFGNWSAEIFMILLEFVSVLLIFILLSGINLKQVYNLAIWLILLTSPVMILFHDPSAEQLSMVLFASSTILIFNMSKSSLSRWFISGILMGFAFFTKFNILFFILLQTGVMIIGYRQVKWKAIIAYLSGFLTVMVLFIILGYYFWLTFLTGWEYSRIYAIQNPVTLIQGFSKILYFGPSVILLLLLLFTDFRQHTYRSFLFVVLLSMIITMIFLWNQGTWNRYLAFYIPVLGLMLLTLPVSIEFKKKDLLIIPLANFIFISLIVFF